MQTSFQRAMEQNVLFAAADLQLVLVGSDTVDTKAFKKRRTVCYTCKPVLHLMYGETLPTNIVHRMTQELGPGAHSHLKCALALTTV